MAAQPGFHVLVGDQFGIHVLAARQVYRERLGLHNLAGVDIDDDRPCTEVDLGGLSRGMVEALVGRGRRRQSQSVHVKAAMVQFHIPGFIENVTGALVGGEDYDGG
jgi:hypothetical protein